MPESNAELPAALPAEVAALGTPDRVFAPETGGRPPLAYLGTTSAIASVGLFGWGAAALFTGLIVLPGMRPPPREIVLYAGMPSFLVGSAFLIWAACHGAGGAIRRQAYVFYKDVVVELFADRHRIIPWSKLGMPQVFGKSQRCYRFPVRDGKPLWFDYTLRRHDQLAKALACQVLRQALGGDAEFAGLSTSGPAPFFLANNCSLRRATYRLSVVGNSLLLLQVGEGVMEDPMKDKAREARATRAAVGAGALGGLAVAMGMYSSYLSYERFRLNMARVEGASQRELFQFAGELPGSFLIPADDLLDLRFEPPSLWQQLGLTYAGAGQLTIVRRSVGRLRLVLPSPKDITTAKHELAKLRPTAEISLPNGS